MGRRWSPRVTLEMQLQQFKTTLCEKNFNSPESLSHKRLENQSQAIMPAAVLHCKSKVLRDHLAKNPVWTRSIHQRASRELCTVPLYHTTSTRVSVQGPLRGEKDKGRGE